MEAAYLLEVAPDSNSYLEKFRETIVRFHMAGHSRKSTYRFLQSRRLIGCSQATFYRWVAAHVNFAAEVAALKSDAVSGCTTVSVSGKVSHRGVDAARAAALGGSKNAEPSTVHSSFNKQMASAESRIPSLDSAASARQQRLQALDAVLDDMSQNSTEALTARALGRLAARKASSSDPPE